MSTAEALVELDTLERIFDGGATEGPVWHPDGHLTFVRHRVSELLRWDPDGGATVIRKQTGTGNGCTLDLDGNLVMCEGGSKRVTRMDGAGQVSEVVSRYRGGRFNAPNDIVCRTDGLLFFTDPEARTPVAQREIGFSGVYTLRPDGDISLATDECEYPNGLAFSPDESQLYVAISRKDADCYDEVSRGESCPHRLLRVFDVAEDGTLSGNRVFAPMVAPEPIAPDGVKVDADGRVWATGPRGIWVFSPAGDLLGVVPVPEHCRNLAFDGAERSTLYITAGDSVYRIRTRVRGLVGPRGTLQKELT